MKGRAMHCRQGMNLLHDLVCRSCQMHVGLPTFVVWS